MFHPSRFYQLQPVNHQKALKAWSEGRLLFYWASVGNIRSAKKKALSEIFKPEPVSDIIRPTGPAFLAWTMTLALMFPDELITGNNFLSDFFLIVKVLMITSQVFTTVLWQFFSKPDKFLDNSFYPHVWVFQESSSVWDGMLLTSFLIVKVLQTVFLISDFVQILNSTVLVPRESGRVWHRSERWVRWNANLSSLSLLTWPPPGIIRGSLNYPEYCCFYLIKSAVLMVISWFIAA